MKHEVIVFPKVAKPEPLVKYIHDALRPDHVIASRTVSLTNPWNGDWIKEEVASYFDCSTDDVESIETDEHSDGLAIKGELVAFIQTN